MRNKPVSERCRGLLWLLSDERGATAVLVAIALPVLFAFGALAINSGFWYTMKRQNQSAADAAALSAAYEVMAGTANATAAATEAATQNGWVNTGTAPAVNVSYSNPPLVPSGVEVILHQDQGSLFAYVPAASATIATRAVALVKTLDNPCMILLNPTASKELNIQGSASLSMPGCSIYADSTATDSIYAQGANNSILTADTIITAGQVSTTGQPRLTLTNPAQIGAPRLADPYAATLTHSFLTSGMPSSCPAPTIVGSVYTYTGPCKFAGGLAIDHRTVNLTPGTYWVTDGDLALGANGVLECTACVPGGAGVTIILTTAQTSGGTVGNVTMQGNPTIDSLNAPGSGTYTGLLLIQDSNNLPTGTTYTTGGSTFKGTPGQTLDGLVYFPKNAMTFQGNPTTGANSCLLVVADTLTLAGNSSMASSGCPTSGPGAPPTVKTVALAE